MPPTIIAPKSPLRAITMDREEFIGDIAFNKNQPAQLPTKNGQVPSDRFMFGLRLSVEFRVTNPAAGQPTAVLADAPYSILNNLHIEGYHRGRAVNEPFYDLRGAEARELNLLYSSRAPSSTILVNGTAASALSVAASATNDVRFFIDIIFPPEQMPSGDQLLWILDAPNYNNLYFTLFWGDDTSLFSGQTTPPTFSAYGLTTGNPRCRVVGIFAQQGANQFQGFIPGRVFRDTFETVSGDIVSGNTNSRLFNIPTGYRIRSLLLKSGVKATTTSAGNNAYASLSDTILSNIKVMRGTNKIVRYFPDFFHLKEATANTYAIKLDTGYAMLDFAKRRQLGETINAAGLTSGRTGDVDFFVQSDIAGAANQAALMVVQELRGVPIVPT